MRCAVDKYSNMMAVFLPSHGRIAMTMVTRNLTLTLPLALALTPILRVAQPQPLPQPLPLPLPLPLTVARPGASALQECIVRCAVDKYSNMMAVFLPSHGRIAMTMVILTLTLTLP